MRKIISFSIIKEIRKGLERDPDFPELINDYEEYHKTSKVNVMSKKRVELIADWIEPNSKILDVGCGEGYTAKYLYQTRNVHIIGVDISAEAIAKFRRLTGLKGYVADVNRGLKLAEDEYFDYILFLEVLEHLVYPHKVLIEAIKHSKKGVIVTLPNLGYFRWRLQLLCGYFPRQSFTHLHSWTIRDFELFCHKLGLHILDFKTILPKEKYKAKIVLRFRNWLAYQQCWLLAGNAQRRKKE